MRPVARATLLLSGLMQLVGTPANADADGWYKWQVEGNTTTGSSCCFRLAGTVSQRTTCDLDNGNGIVISDSPCEGASGHSTYYMRKEGGVPVRIRVYDANCEVSSSAPITNMGSLSPDESVAMLLDIVNERKLGMDVREEALFWLAQSNTDSAFAYFDELLSDS